ncbi:ankyrin protein [Fusarium sp. NRRL 25303]|nr:ankyrin protein [Fusarium sp. NRRL 25303]
MPVPSPDSESAYLEFVQASEGRIEDEDPPYIPMTMTNQNGSVLCETENFDLLRKIICRDDVTTLKKYLAIAPLLIEEVDELPCYYSFFYIAVSSGSLGALKVLLDQYSTVVAPGRRLSFKQRGFLLLNEAARRAHIDIVQFLLDNQPSFADIQERDPQGCTAILAAADFYSTRYKEAFDWQPLVERSTAVIEMLLDRGACASDVVLADAGHKQSTIPDTVLTLAVQWAGSGIIKRLIDEGADIDAKVTKDSFHLGLYNQDGDIHEVRAIHMASFHANSVAIDTLHSYRGANNLDTASVRDSRGSIPLHWAARNQLRKQAYTVSRSELQQRVHNILTTINLLLDMDPATVNDQDIAGNTPLHYAVHYFLENGKLYTAIFKLLCRRGADASIYNSSRQTPLFNLLDPDNLYIPDDTEAISILLANGATVNDTDNAGNTVLHHAARNLRNSSVISFLLNEGADGTAQNMKQNTPLHIAASAEFMPNVPSNRAYEKVNAQNKILSQLAAGGKIELPDPMSMSNSEGKTPRQLLNAKREKWNEIDRQLDQQQESMGRGMGRGMSRGIGRGRGRGMC